MNSDFKYSYVLKINLYSFKSNSRFQAYQHLFMEFYGSSGGYCTSVIVGSGVYSNTLATLFTHFPTVWKVKCSVVGTRVLAVL